MQPIDLTDTFIHLGTGPDVATIDVDETFWATIGDRTELHTGRLVMASEMSDDWDTWEMHPEGDELIMVVRGGGPGARRSSGRAADRDTGRRGRTASGLDAGGRLAHDGRRRTGARRHRHLGVGHPAPATRKSWRPVVSYPAAMEMHWATVWESIADTIPDAPAVTNGATTRS